MRMFFSNRSLTRSLLGGVALLVLFAVAGIKYEGMLSAASQGMPIEIEILPGENPKFIDTSRPFIPVALLGGENFDAASVDPVSVRLAGAPITKAKDGRFRSELRDVNGDGRIDLVVYVSVYSLHLADGTSDAVLTATMADGTSVSGSQQVSFKGPVVQRRRRSVAIEDINGVISNPGLIKILDNDPKPTNGKPYPSTITVAGQPTISSLTVSIFGLWHTFPDDVDILLVGPTGATCVLMADCGGGNFITSNNPVDLAFTNGAPSLPDNGQIVTGTYGPTRGTCFGGGDNCMPATFPPPAPAGPYGTALTVFNGTNPTGDWLLYVIDDSAGDDGQILSGWSLNINNASPPAYQGFHDGAGCDTIQGWAWDANNPNGSVNVDIYDGTTLIGTSPANMYREDLLNALGSPNHGFSFNTPASLRNGAAHTINVKFSGTNTLLSNTGRTVQCSQAPNLFGRHDGQGCNAIEGWAWDSNDKNGTVNVDIYDGSTLLGSVAATLYRQDLADALGSPYHGWIFHTPASLRDGQPHTITAKFGGTNTNLPLDTPRTTSCTSLTPNYQGNLDVADCNFISGFAWDANDGEGTIVVAIYVDGNFLVVVPAQEAYPGVGTGFHGFKFAVPASLKNGQPHSINVKFSGTSTNLSGTPKSITCP